MSDIDLMSMGKDELLSLQKQVNKAVASFEERARSEAMAKLEATAQELGFSLSELTGGKKTGKINPPKYRNPDDPSKTWTGRGRQPQWIKDAIAAGKDLAELAI